MLSHLSISNYALIDSLEIDFKEGLSIVTGETGAGKSIILGALSLILGERADQKVVRNANAKSVIEATFDILKYKGINEFLAQNDIEPYDNECILRREISSNGRSRAFINDTPVNLAVLRELTLQLIDIHSQHSNMLLSDAGYQLRIIDSVSSNNDILNRYTASFNEYKALKERLSELKRIYEKNKQDEDYIQFQLSQIADLKLAENEDEELEREQARLSNVSDIKQNLWAASSVIQDDQNSVLTMLTGVSRGFMQIEGVDNELKEISERLQSAVIDLKDLARTVDALQEVYVDNPNELERINERLNVIYDLETKHKVRSVNELIALQREYESKLALLDNSDDEIKRLEKELVDLERTTLEIGKELSKSRKNGCEQFKRKLQDSAMPLGMKNMRFDVGFGNVPLSETGIDKVIFLFSFNKQQQLMPIENTASGGELSRVMLCVKSIIAQNMQLPTIIFDEVDTGVSGEIAHKMGEMMSDISKNIQVIAITHLPQVAVKGENHYKVFKTDSDDATYTSIVELTKEERVNEIARMLSGKEVDNAAIENAKSLLGYN